MWVESRERERESSSIHTSPISFLEKSLLLVNKHTYMYKVLKKCVQLSSADHSELYNITISNITGVTFSCCLWVILAVARQ